MSVVFEPGVPRFPMDPAAYSAMAGHDDNSVPEADPTAFTNSNVDVDNLVNYNPTATLMGPDDDHLTSIHSPTVTSIPAVPSVSTVPTPTAAAVHSVQSAHSIHSVPTTTALSTAAAIQVGVAAPPGPPSPTEDMSPSPPPRAKLVAKPEREATKNLDGKFECAWKDCPDEVKTFSRKCEYNKHMDKHDRPYKCQAGGCEKLPGFTYSGGLLRHEREVHGLYGGPKNPLHCPHVTCKRHSGKGFSRQENLNEHLRRVHTQAGEGSPNAQDHPMDGDATPTTSGEKTRSGHKRKRSSYDENATSGNLAEEVRKLRLENRELKEQIKAQTLQTVAMINQITQLQSNVGAQLPNVPTDML